MATNPTASSSSSASPSSASAALLDDDIALANNVAAWLRRAQSATARRDDALALVSTLVSSGDQSASDLEDCVSSVLHQQLPSIAPSVSAVAEAVSASARVAEGSYRRVKTIDRSLSRVSEALDVTRSVLKMRSSLDNMSQALTRGDIEGASAAVAEYDETSRKLKGREKLLMHHHAPSATAKKSTTTTGGGGGGGGIDATGNNSDTDSFSGRDASTDSSGFTVITTASASQDQGAFVQDTRAKVHDAAMAQLEKASAAGDETAIRSCVTVLSRLAFVDDAERTFAEFIAQKNRAELKALVGAKGGLEAARTAHGASHLELVRQLLDHTVSCLESQAPFVNQFLGGRVRSLLLALHNQSAALCVEVLDDFLSQRKLHSVGLGGKSLDGVQHDQKNQPLGDPVVVDQQLQDLANLMVCCSTYFNFLANKLQVEAERVGAATTTTTTAGGGAGGNGNNNTEQEDQQSEKEKRHRHMMTLHEAQNLVRKNNLLFDRVQDLLAIFVPLQIDYFDAACQVAIKDSMDALARFEREFLQKIGGTAQAAAAVTNGGGGNSSSAGRDISGFFANVAAALGGGGSDNSNNTNSGSKMVVTSAAAAAAAGGDLSSSAVELIQVPSVDAIDDIFFACRVAVHRVMGTRTAQIASPTLMVINNNVLRDKLLPMAQSRTFVFSSPSSSSTNGNASPSRTLTPKSLLGMITALVWAGALSSISSNCKHLADEIGLLAERCFSDNQDDVMRFAAQRLDFVQTASASDDALEQACKAIGTDIFRMCGGASIELRSAGFVDTVPAVTAATAAGAAVGLNKNSGAAGGGAKGGKENGDDKPNSSGNSTASGDAAMMTVGASDETAALDWVPFATGRFGAVLSNVMLPSGPWPESVRCSVISTFLDCAVAELEDTLKRKRYDVSGALRLDRDLRLLRNYFSATNLDIAVRDKFKRLSAVTTVLLAERKGDANAMSSVLSQQEITALLKQRVDPPAS